MGQGVNKTKRLHSDAIKRNIEALEEYKSIAEDYEVKEMFIFEQVRSGMLKILRNLLLWPNKTWNGRDYFW